VVKQASLVVATRRERELVEMTELVGEAVRSSGIQTGVCHVFVTGATAGIVMHEGDDPALQDDLLDLLRTVVPPGRWRHDRIDNNAAAHLCSAWIGVSETLPVRGGSLLLGTWQRLFLCEFDGPRSARQIWVTVYGE